MGREVGNEALAAFGIGVAAVHEAMNVSGGGYAVFCGDINEFEEMVQRGMDTAVRCQSHQVEAFAVFLGIFVGSDYLRIFKDAAVGTGTVDFHEVLIDDTSGADIEVSHFGIAHLSVGKPYVFAAGQQLGVRIRGVERVHEGSRRFVNDIAFVMFADAPAVEDHK